MLKVDISPEGFAGSHIEAGPGGRGALLCLHFDTAEAATAAFKSLGPLDPETRYVLKPAAPEVEAKLAEGRELIAKLMEQIPKGTHPADITFVIRGQSGIDNMPPRPFAPRPPFGATTPGYHEEPSEIDAATAKVLRDLGAVPTRVDSPDLPQPKSPSEFV